MHFALLPLVLAAAWFNEPPTLDMDKAAFPSPDGKEVASFQHNDDGWDYLVVKDAKTGQPTGSDKYYLPPVFSVQWTHDGQSIVVVGHVAHGSTTTLFHLDAGKWSSFIFYPPDFQDPNTQVFYNVAKVEAREHEVVLTYELEVGPLNAPDESVDKHYLVTVKLDPASKKIISSERTIVR